ncbi:NifU family protein [Natrinema salifodinae]|uniref:Fe-S cluster biogenesis protein NfuA, 4Fe-4S-binding domain n=1 Tax=Natrinema salifodinae TaxID=1202768 RepID=A0A1I0QX77_9EURY|nr:NifU family protein [Natrinema salifodinae]SEW32389.1 Fe-S cluster biogenesis protein NfuA, 4Fe-4S-binding domain [Natrinema salifodinae]
MSDSDAERSPEDAVREDVSLFLRRNFPQIEMHGGDSTITDLDLDERRVSINLSGACSGCGVSPMTTQAIRQRLPAEIDAIDRVDVSTGLDGLAEQGSSGRDVPPDTPF